MLRSDDQAPNGSWALSVAKTTSWAPFSPIENAGGFLRRAPGIIGGKVRVLRS